MFKQLHRSLFILSIFCLVGILSTIQFPSTANNPNFIQSQKLAADDYVGSDYSATYYDFLGESVAIDGDTALVAAPYDNEDANTYGTAYGIGAVYVFVRNGTEWTLQQKLRPPVINFRENFGEAIALDGDTAAIGAPGSANAVYLFNRVNGVWTHSQTIQQGSESFGISIALEDDTLLVGDSGDIQSGFRRGAGFVYTRYDGVWSLQKKLQVPFKNEHEFYGTVALSNNFAVLASNSVSSNTGDAYIFTRTGTTWDNGVSLKPADVTAWDNFGYAVEFMNDKLAITAPYGGTGNTGVIYLFSYNGNTWSYEAVTSPVTTSNGFGWILVSQSNELLVPANNSIYRYALSGNTLTEIGQLLDANSQPVPFNASNLRSESLAWDGTTILRGDAYHSHYNPNSGIVDVFVESAGAWAQQGTLLQTIFSAPDADPLDNFGMQILIDGDNALVSAPGATGYGTNFGLIYHYRRSGDLWLLEGRIEPPPTETSEFGSTIALSGDKALIAGDQQLYSYIYSNGAWIYEGTVPLVPDDLYNYTGKMAFQGDTLIVPIYPGFNLERPSQAAHIFNYSNGVWSLQQIIEVQDAAWIELAEPLNVSLDGNTFLLSFPSGINYDANYLGQAYVFVYNGSLWEQQAVLNPSDNTQVDNFGIDMSLHGDTALISRYLYEVPNPSQIYVFKRNGTTWTEQQIIPLNSDDEISFALTDNLMLIGNPQTSSTSIYTPDENGVWQLSQEITGHDTGLEDSFGLSVDVHDNVIMVGAPRHALRGLRDAGAVYVFNTSGLPMTPTFTPEPATATNTAVVPTLTFTSEPATATHTEIPPTLTSTPEPATATNTAVPPTSTFTAEPPIATSTSVPATSTFTPEPATATNTEVPATATNTAVVPTVTFTAEPPIATSTSVPATSTFTPEPATATNTEVPVTLTNTAVVSTVTFTAEPPTATNTEVPPTATSTSVPATSTFTPEPATATNTEVPATPTFTAIAPVELLKNGGFEEGGTQSLPANWTPKGLGLKDKRVCNRINVPGKPDKIVAHSGNCAFQFKGAVNKTAFLRQTLKEVTISAGDTLILSGWMHAKKAQPGAPVLVKVFHVDGSVQKFKLNLSSGTTGGYIELSHQLTVLEASNRIRVQLAYAGAVGWIRFDDLSLIKIVQP